MLYRNIKFAAILPALALLILLLPACKGRSPKTSCIYGNDIPDEQLHRIMDAGDMMIGLLIDQNYLSIYEAASKITKKNQTRDQFVAVMRGSEKSFGKMDFPRLEEAYLIESKAKDGHVTVACNPGVKGADDLYLVKANQKTAVLVYNATAKYGTLRVVLHLVWEDENWKLYSVVPNPASIKGHLGAYYITRARKSREDNILRVASLQYQLATILFDKGPNIDEILIRQTLREAQEIKVDYMPQNMVQIWETSEDKIFKVYNIGVMIAQGKIFVDISYMTKSLSETERIEKESRELIRFVKEKFPEYGQEFDGLVISARSENPKELYRVYRVVEHFN